MDRRLRQASARLALAFVISGLTLALHAWLALAGVPATEVQASQESGDAWFLANVPVGGPAWNTGVRAGMEIIGIAPPETPPDGDWESLFVTDGVVKIEFPRYGLPPEPAPVGVGVVALLLAVLAARYVPNVAWGLTLVPPLLAAAGAPLTVGPPLNLALVAGGPLIAALYASDPARRLGRAAAVLAWVVAGGFLASWFVAYASQLEDWHLPGNLSIAVTLALGALGAAGVIRSAWLRGIARPGNEHVARGPLGVRIGLLADELVPGRQRTRLSASEREQARLAGDLHADVLPDLAAVIRAVEAGATPEETAARLRAVAGELRELMSDRRVAILEELGLVPALEWLAGQVEERTRVRVDLVVTGGASTDPQARPPREVELAAYRICQQALDNALLHARPRLVRVLIDVDASRVSLALSDDGVGIAPEAESRALRLGHLGLADMRQRAAAIGGALTVAPRDGGGTVVSLRWQT